MTQPQLSITRIFIALHLPGMKTPYIFAPKLNSEQIHIHFTPPHQFHPPPRIIPEAKPPILLHPPPPLSFSFLSYSISPSPPLQLPPALAPSSPNYLSPFTTPIKSEASVFPISGKRAGDGLFGGFGVVGRIGDWVGWLVGRGGRGMEGE